MPLRISITNRQSVRRVDKSQIKRLAGFVMERVAQAMPSRLWREISVVLADDAGIADVNKRFLGHTGPTDVISFKYEPISDKGDALDAEIIVNVQRALAVGPRFGGASRELALYIAHGCDHLSGADDRTATQRQCMRRRELRWLQKAGRMGLLSGLIAQRASKA